MMVIIYYSIQHSWFFLWGKSYGSYSMFLIIKKVGQMQGSGLFVFLLENELVWNGFTDEINTFVWVDTQNIPNNSGPTNNEDYTLINH